MLSVDLSNIWCSVSLPKLLQEEKGIFDAHMALAGGVERQNGWQNWFSQSDAAAREWMTPAEQAAMRIRTGSDYLVVVGGGLCTLGVRAALSLMPERSSSLRLIFCGEDCSTERWLRIVDLLENASFSVLAVSSTGTELTTLLTMRSLRRILEARWGDKARDRIYVSAPEHSSLYRTAKMEGCTALAMPTCPGGCTSVLSPAGLTILGAAGLRIPELYEGARDMAEQSDIRSFENPVWLCTGTQIALRQQGFVGQTLCTATPDAELFGKWWQQSLSAAEKNGFYASVCLPEDFFRMGEQLLRPNRFVTLLLLPRTAKRVAVETDWKDMDGLNCLAGRDLEGVEATIVDTLRDTLMEHGVPTVTVQCEEALTPRTLGELVYFVELTVALTAAAAGEDPGAQPGIRDFRAKLDRALGRNSSNM